MMSSKRVVDEIEILVKDYGARELAFIDDNLTYSKNRMKEICREIIRRKFNIKWCTPNGVAVWTLDEELLDLMKKSGLYKITFGIETGSKRTQEFIRKSHIDLEKAKKIIEYCNKIGLWTHSSFIIGFPYETEKDIEETINYAVESDLDFASFFIATPFPGTPLYEIYKSEGLIPDMGESKAIKWEGCQQEVMTDTIHLKKEELEGYLREAHRRFYKSRIRKFLNLMRVLRKIGGRYELAYFLKLLMIARSELNRIT
jgi:anaerobic magnesium-protoporphyrin IX monomethyl ester cyclase